MVEHLVYTERVGGSKPSPPILRLRRVEALNREQNSGFVIQHSAFSANLCPFVVALSQHFSDGGCDMDFCCVEKRNAVVNGIAKN